MNAPHNGFSEEQQSYLQGLMLGTDVARAIRKLPIISGSGAMVSGATVQIGPAKIETSETTLPRIHLEAQQRWEATGNTLVAEEKAKRDKNALTMWSEIGDRAKRNEFPKGTDVFLTKYNGLFYVAPAQNAFMCRMRLPGGFLRADQLAGLADIADEYAGGYADVTTRANLQLREIQAEDALSVLMGLRDLGIVTLGSGADNVRNVTCSTLSGIDASELIETYPYARELHYHILNKPELYGLPRKFNIAFEGSGRISSLAETNDVSFHAVRVEDPLDGTRRVDFLLGLGGITGHGDFAKSSGILVPPAECVEVSEAILRVFIKHGDRTDRKKARLKYLLDAWGVSKFLLAVEQELGRSLMRVSDRNIDMPNQIDRWAHVGVHAQKQEGLYYVGVTLPVGRLTSMHCRALAALAKQYGKGELRLTVWQNLLLTHIEQEHVGAVTRAIEEIGLQWQASGFRSGLVACTGSAGCKYAGADTKKHAMMIAEYLEERIELDVPINIHVTGCHHSCAQHAIGDIGLLATKVEVEEELVEGYHIFIGGQTGSEASIGKRVFDSIPMDAVPEKIEWIIRAYLKHRHAGQSFADFAKEYPWQGPVLNLSTNSLIA